MTDSLLVKLAIESTEKAYAPYSGYRVGAAIECKSGKVYTGCNVENASYSVCICAERSALASAVSDGSRDIAKIAIAASGDGICFPCGVCRQALFEFNPHMVVLCADKNGRYEQHTLSSLLPHGFGLDNTGTK